MDNKRPILIAGPCSAESEGQVMSTAAELSRIGVGIFRAGIWKPRTRPGCFEGVGEKGLSWLRRVREQTGMKVCTEVAGARHVRSCLDAGIDMVWIGARTTSNPFLMQELAEALQGSGIPVLVKNPVGPDIDLWTGAVERLQRRGVYDICLVHRGFPAFGGLRYRNMPCWNVALEMHRRFPGLPMICDPSHMGGDREFVAEISRTALDYGFDGLMVECHCNPSCALSDARQQLTPARLGDILASLRDRKDTDAGFAGEVEALRERIDAIDDSIVRLMADRMEVSRGIGRLKKKSDVAVIQPVRWNELMETVYSQSDALGLERSFVDAVFNRIHDASANEQNKIINGDDSR